ncbi:tungstate/molybdate transport system ATP-binding protein [Sulfuritortus calidifontis]|uniref:Tungstate/molybdate transport system ATP-binding protein n=1 Tax=Sulfuritortus calidifontis TaxID=1914471 RepID=A0A4V2UQX2_9PROT|nr:ABC transporter ATP-binding protein [Sulfuritortus calidifontis]TCS73087.1 tungstate/molybdate transport system ATP-binding protein [Sulfuritortus calidifontis]
MLEIDRLAAQAGDFRLGEVSLTAGAGECHAVLGPSGSGKSTLLAAVLGTLPVASGRVRLAGEDITRLPMEQRHLGYLPQHLGLFPHLSVLDNLRYSARARHLPEREYRPLLDRLVEITGIGTLLQRRIANLSGGERQRVALVRALAANPRLVLLDEPFTALNESLRRELWWLMKDLQRERGLTVLLVTHDLSEAYFLADHITVLIDGRQEQSGDKSTVYRRPASEPVARFLGLKNLYPAHRVGAGIVDCPALGGRLVVTGADVSGDETLLAIRAEHVALRQADDPPRDGETRLTGRFEAVLDLGEAALLHFRADSGALLEIRCGSRVLRKYDLQAGKPGTVGLPASDLFAIRRRGASELSWPPTAQAGALTL